MNTTWRYLWTLAVPLAGCTDFSPLTEAHYDRVVPELVVEAGADPAHADSIAGLLGARLEQPDTISEEVGIEAAIALGKSGSVRHGELLLDVARRDPSASVRYFALRSLQQLDPGLLASQIPALQQQETDGIVRDYLTDVVDGNA